MLKLLFNSISAGTIQIYFISLSSADKNRKKNISLMLQDDFFFVIKSQQYTEHQEHLWNADIIQWAHSLNGCHRKFIVVDTLMLINVCIKLCLCFVDVNVILKKEQKAVLLKIKPSASTSVFVGRNTFEVHIHVKCSEDVTCS